MKFKPLSETKYIWIIIILLSIIALVFKSVYREYIYANDIHDFGVADSSPNFFAALIIVCFYFTQYQNMSLRKYAIYSAVGLVGYEVIQGTVFKHNYFDYKDIIASILGAFVGYAVGSILKGRLVFSGQK